MIQQGLLGEFYDLEVRVTVLTPWHLFPNVVDLPRMEIQQHSVHYVDLIRSFFGDPVGVLARTIGHPENDMASTRTTIIMDYGNEKRATITANHDHSFGSRHQESSIKWEGTKGAIKAQFGVLKDYPRGEPDSFEYCLKDGDKPGPWESVELPGILVPGSLRWHDGQRHAICRGKLDRTANVGGRRHPYDGLRRSGLSVGCGRRRTLASRFLAFPQNVSSNNQHRSLHDETLRISGRCQGGST